MEVILDLYCSIHDYDEPLITMDEAAIQLTWTSIPTHRNETPSRQKTGLSLHS